MKPRIALSDCAKRHALHVRIDLERLERYRRAAGGEALSRWVLDTLDRAVERKGPAGNDNKRQP